MKETWFFVLVEQWRTIGGVSGRTDVEDTGADGNRFQPPKSLPLEMEMIKVATASSILFQIKNLLNQTADDVISTLLRVLCDSVPCSAVHFEMVSNRLALFSSSGNRLKKSTAELKRPCQCCVTFDLWLKMLLRDASGMLAASFEIVETILGRIIYFSWKSLRASNWIGCKLMLCDLWPLIKASW